MIPATAISALPFTALSPEDEAALTALYRRGTPVNSLRALERDLVYIAAWKRAVFGADLAWPEEQAVALRFVLDHSRDLSTDQDTASRRAAESLIAAGLRRELGCPAPATLDRRIASWRTLHRMRNLPNPFAAPLVAESRVKARRAAARPRKPKSPHPITRALLEQLLNTCDDNTRGLRDRALLMLAFASGGRRRSELTALDLQDVETAEFARTGIVWIRLLTTKTTRPETAPRLPLKGRAARAVTGWIAALEAGDETGRPEGPLFRPVSRAGRALPRRLAPDAPRVILRHRLALAGLSPDHASPHGLRAGFLTQAALDGAPLAAAMQLSLHRSAVQAQRYYADVEITENPATDLLETPPGRKS